ncbi:hypothetical protein KDK95_02970 [Actinospica sp. MGRD01-02]|uniref:DUF4034 domain-containing protein n=1 Tax=Actinospica acidithermotolerans TaxID=2828514 RepID=A0A941IFN9_9ACTN|nr:hypothetical protein [Actinospica acidithermotolerans]MBR7825254.1 hypothetical protein [Actinospica acidithermotolerans]
MPIFGLGKKKSASAAAGRPTVSAPPAPSAAKALPGLPEARTLRGGGDADLVALLKLAEARDWTALRAGFAGFAGYDQGALISGVCADAGLLGDWLPETLKDAGDDPIAQAALGMHLINAGWAVRTAKRAQHVSQDQFRRFHEILRAAEEHLYASIELDPDSSIGWFGLLQSGIGLQVGREAQQQRFESTINRVPGHAGAYRRMHTYLHKKWFGSHESMHEFATEAMRGPYGDVLGELVAVSYVEHYLDLPKDTGERDFVKSAESRAELLEAAERSVFRADYSCPRNPYFGPNMFALAFYYAEMWPQAKAAFEITEGVATGWNYYSGDPIDLYTRFRNTAYKRAGA